MCTWFIHEPIEGALTKSSREIMEILEAFDLTRCAWSAAELAGCDAKTVARYVRVRDRGGDPFAVARRARLLDPILDKVEELVEASQGSVRADVVHERLVAMGFPVMGAAPSGRSRRPRRRGVRVTGAGTEVSHYVGVDWGTEQHTVCVLRGDGRVATRFTVTHSLDGFRQLHNRLAAFGDPAEVPVGIERPDGRLVDALLEAGHPVVPVKPHAIKQWRDGEVLSGAKSDAGDAEVIAEYLRLRAHRLRVATPYSGETKALRTLVRTRDDFIDMRVAASNQLAALLDAYWPGAKAVFANIESPIALHFLARYPTPAAAAHLGEKRLATFCRHHGYSGRRSAAELLGRLLAHRPASPTPPSPRHCATASSATSPCSVASTTA